MVDLVKIRKKAREKKERDAADAAAAAAAEARRRSTPVEPSPAPRSAPVPTIEPAAPPMLSRLEQFRQEVIARQMAHSEAGDQAADREDARRDATEILTFWIGNEQFALPVTDISEIVEPREVTRVPNAPTDVRGIISVRGTIVTILDVSSRLGHVPAMSNPDSRFLIVDDSSGRSGFVVDRVGRVTVVENSEIRQEPTLIQAEQSGRIRGVYRREGELIMLLNVERLLRGDQ